MSKYILIKEESIGDYSIKLYADDFDLAPYVVYSHHENVIEQLEYNSTSEAKDDFKLLVRVIKSVLKCEGINT